MSKAFVFPGQGSQAVGMGKALAEAFPQARRVLAEVDEALGQNLSELMFEGPRAELTLTANAQPALLAVSLAAVRVLEAEAGLILRGTPALSLAIRSANIRRSPRRARWAWGRPRNCCAYAGSPCRRPCRLAPARWRRCLGSITTRPSQSPSKRPMKPAAARSAKSPTIMAVARLWCPGPAPRCIARSKSPRREARAVQFCCRCRRRFIAP